MEYVERELGPVAPALIIRPIAPEDRDAWEPLWDAYHAFYGRSGPTALACDITDMTWSRFLDPNEPVFAQIAEIDANMVGIVHYLFHRNTSTINPVCYLQDLYTVSNARGRGVGRALIAAVYEHAAREHSPRVYWQTHETNRIAMRLYDSVAERSGFVVYRKTL